MKYLSCILAVILALSLLVSYRQVKASQYYLIASTAEKERRWDLMALYSAMARKANPLDHRPLHTLGRALHILGHDEPALAVMREVLKRRPYKRSVLKNYRIIKDAAKKGN